MAGWEFFFVATFLLGGATGCCHYCDSTYASRHPPAVVPAYGAGCVPCQPAPAACCPCPPGYAPVANGVPPPPPPPQVRTNWQIAPGNGCCP